MTVAVALTDLAVTPLDEHLALLVDGDVPRAVNRLFGDWCASISLLFCVRMVILVVRVVCVFEYGGSAAGIMEDKRLFSQDLQAHFRMGAWRDESETFHLFAL